MYFKSSEVLILLAASTMSLLANLPDTMLVGVVERRALIASLLGLVVVALFRYLQVMLLLTICILAIGANLPSDLANQLGISQPALLASLGILVALTLMNRAVRFMPMGTETASELVIEARRALLEAVADGDAAQVERMLATGLNVNFMQDGLIPLHLAADEGHTDIVQTLISRGAVFQTKAKSSGLERMAEATGRFFRAGHVGRRNAGGDMWRG